MDLRCTLPTPSLIHVSALTTVCPNVLPTCASKGLSVVSLSNRQLDYLHRFLQPVWL